MKVKTTNSNIALAYSCFIGKGQGVLMPWNPDSPSKPRPGAASGKQTRKKERIIPAEILLGMHMQELGLKFQRHVRFHEVRKWEWDYTLPDHRIAIEVDGYFKGRHGAGWGSDNEKQNMGTMMGWRCLRFSTQDVERGKARAFLQEWLCGGR